MRKHPAAPPLYDRCYDPFITPALVAGIGLQTLGQIQQSSAARAAGNAQQTALNQRAALRDIEAKNLEARAGQTRAVSQQEALQAKKEGELASSRGLAVAAASGGGTGGSVEGILADIDRQEEINVLDALASGEAAGRSLERSAAIERFTGTGERAEGRFARDTGRFQRRQSLFAAGGTLLQGGASLFDRFGAPFKKTRIPRQSDAAAAGIRGGGF